MIFKLFKLKKYSKFKVTIFFVQVAVKTTPPSFVFYVIFSYMCIMSGSFNLSYWSVTTSIHFWAVGCHSDADIHMHVSQASRRTSLFDYACG
jgi:hypothetical protein